LLTLKIYVDDDTNNNDGSTIPTLTRLHDTESSVSYTSSFESKDAPFNVILSDGYKYQLDWSNGVPTQFKIKASGVDL